MSNLRVHTIFILIFTVSLLLRASMSGTVTESTLKFSKGQNQITLSEKANYGHSYVYNFYAKKGQKTSLEVSSSKSIVKFSFVEETCNKQPAFSMTSWTGILSCNGLHKIVVVMNDEKLNQVPFTVTLKITEP